MEIFIRIGLLQLAQINLWKTCQIPLLTKTCGHQTASLLALGQVQDIAIKAIDGASRQRYFQLEKAIEVTGKPTI